MRVVDIPIRRKSCCDHVMATAVPPPLRQYGPAIPYTCWRHTALPPRESHLNPTSITKKKSASEQLRSVQCLRAVAALFVVGFHGTLLWHDNFLPSVKPWDNGNSGVDLFFVISGFIMMVSSRRLLGLGRRLASLHRAPPGAYRAHVLAHHHSQASVDCSSSRDRAAYLFDHVEHHCLIPVPAVGRRGGVCKAGAGCGLDVVFRDAFLRRFRRCAVLRA